MTVKRFLLPRAVLILVALFSTSCNKNVPIDGQVFIVTMGAENIKFGSIEVQAFDEKEVASAIKASAPLVKNEISLLDAMETNLSGASYVETLLREIKTRRELITSAAGYLAKFPPPVAVTRTDADGKFTLTLPSSPCLIRATATRIMGGSLRRELCTWLVRAKPGEKLLLSNTNLAWSGDNPLSIGELQDEYGSIVPTPATLSQPVASPIHAAPLPDYVTMVSGIEVRDPETFFVYELRRGQKLRPTGITDNQVTVRFRNVVLQVPVSATDLSSSGQSVR